MDEVSFIKCLNSYLNNGSCKKAGLHLGISAQSVYDKLKKGGFTFRSQRKFSNEDRKILAAWYSRPDFDEVGLFPISLQLDRTIPFLSRQAGQLGLTCKRRKVSSATKEKLSSAAKHRLAIGEHPRGFKGRIHSQQSKKKMGQKSSEWWSGLDADARFRRAQIMMKVKLKNKTFIPNRPHGNWKAGWREITGKKIYFRSRWEANYARYLEWLRGNNEILSWEFEPDTLWFNGIKKGRTNYTPDFKVYVNSSFFEYHEVKGWMDARSITQLNRMRKFYPHILLRVIDAKEMRSIEKRIKGLIHDWE